MRKLPTDLVTNNSQQLNAETIIQTINAAIDSDTRNEYEAKIQLDPNTGRLSTVSIIGRRK